MITRRDINDELVNAQKQVTSDEGKALLKVLEIVVKVVVGIRTNTVRLMEKVGVPKVKNQEKEQPTENENQA